MVPLWWSIYIVVYTTVSSRWSIVHGSLQSLHDSPHMVTVSRRRKRARRSPSWSTSDCPMAWQRFSRRMRPAAWPSTTRYSRDESHGEVSLGDMGLRWWRCLSADVTLMWSRIIVVLLFIPSYCHIGVWNFVFSGSLVIIWIFQKGASHENARITQKNKCVENIKIQHHSKIVLGECIPLI